MPQRSKLMMIEAFCLTFEQGNFSKAAREMGLTPQAVSRAVGALEADLGTLLFRRNTRHVEPTPEAGLYYEACRSALGTLEGAEVALRARGGEPAGVVRVSVPTTYGHYRFVPMLPAFFRQYPQIEVDVEIANQNVDFVREGFDLAIRMGQLQDATFIARRLGMFPLGVFASPAYLERHGTPETPDDLANHQCGVFIMPSTGRIRTWTFDPGPEVFIPKAAVRIRHDVLGLVTFARAGGGVIQLYHYTTEEAVKRGELVEIMKDYRGAARPFSLLYPRRASAKPEVRCLIDFILKKDREAGLGV